MRAHSAISILLISASLAACSVATQTTSGQDWLAAYPKTKTAIVDGDIDAQVRSVAAVEPNLRFPARIGIARLGSSGLAPIPSEEAEHWSEVASRLGPSFGAFVLPTQNVKAAGVAQAMLIDVRNGYPYGTVRSSTSDDGLSTRFNSSERGRDLRNKVMVEAVGKLTGETEDMLRRLQPELAALDLRKR